jgi:hypothetical protein
MLAEGTFSSKTAYHGAACGWEGQTVKRKK